MIINYIAKHFLFVTDSNAAYLGSLKGSALKGSEPFTLLTQYVFGTLTPNATEKAQADLNKDGQLTAQDMKIMQRALIGLSTAMLEQLFSEMPVLFAKLFDSLIPDAYAAVGDGKIYYVHNDHLGTPKAMTDELGVKVWGAVHDPFGKATIDAGSTVELNVRFPGQYYDLESGLHYNYFRYYNPETGRYVTSDPIGLDGGVNTFGYVENNPLIYTDPLGLLPVMPWPEFGDVCGNGTNAGMIPDGIYKKACENHDKCYSTCGKTKQQCDEAMILDGAPIYALVLMLSNQAKESYDDAQQEAGCDDCDE